MIGRAGDLIRPEVLELRERRLYNQMLGSGTYTFQLERGGRPMCVDASQKGNMAHLINHSCEPNCFSTTKSIFFPQGMREHVIIIAKRDIPVGTELTYNYRCASFLPVRVWKVQHESRRPVPLWGWRAGASPVQVLRRRTTGMLLWRRQLLRLGEQLVC